MYGAVFEDFEDLTDKELSQQPDNGCGKECASYLRVIHNGETDTIRSDAMEPEDCSFYRDLSWISTELERAYNLGFEDGQKEAR